jgi:hypothetical protein
MDGIDPYAFMQTAAGRLASLDAAGLERLLDDLEYLYEAMDPELQSLADGLMERVRLRLKEIRRT